MKMRMKNSLILYNLYIVKKCFFWILIILKKKISIVNNQIIQFRLRLLNL